MKYGPHLSKDKLSPLFPLPFGWNAVQIFNNSPFNLTSTARPFFKMKNVSVCAHGAYVSSAYSLDPQGQFDYFRRSLGWCQEYNINFFIIHAGSSEFLKKDAVSQIKDLQKKLTDLNSSVKLLVENVANVNNVINEDDVLEIICETPNMGLCLDTAHAWAAGWKNIPNRILKYKPPVLHLNALAEYLQPGSNLDRHGWFYQESNQRLLPELKEILAACKTYDPILIFEGASYAGDISEEINFVRKVAATV